MRGMLIRAGMACVIALALVGVVPAAAGAETYTGVTAASDEEIEIDRLAGAYEEAQDKLNAATTRAAEIQEQIDRLQEQIPVQQARSDAAMRQRYIMQSNPVAIMEALLDSSTLGDFLKQTEYIERVSAANLAEINRLRELNEQLAAAQKEQQRVTDEAQAKADEAQAALVTAQDERAARQRAGVAQARKQAAEQGGEASVGVAYDGGEQPEDYREAATPDTAALADGADWHSDREAFITEWAPRIDAYLEGSPLAGQGVNFATSAWRYNIDPRWSPAISNTESSKGRYCIRPHNAWGWGAADADPYGLALEWDSWEDAIDAHVKGLSEGYGYTITMNGAKAYCPNTWQSWYNRTLGEMAKI